MAGDVAGEADGAYVGRSEMSTEWLGPSAGRCLLGRWEVEWYAEAS